MEETDRRREKQLTYNIEHNITPKSITKAVADIMEGAYGAVNARNPKTYARVAEDSVDYSSFSGKELTTKIAELEKQMYNHAQNLEFEEAAQTRDEVLRLQKRQLELLEV